MKVNDYVILVDDESPEQCTDRTGKKFSKRNRIPGQKVGYVDKIKTISSDNILTETHNFNCNKSGREDSSKASERANRKEPVRRALLIPPGAFMFPTGMSAKIESIILDPRTIEALERYHKWQVPD